MQVDHGGEGSGGIVPVTRFTTDAFAPQDRFAAWREEHPLSPSRFMESRPETEFRARTAWFSLGPRPLHFTDISAQHWQRTARHLRDDMEAVVVNVRFTGGARGDMDGTALSVPGGSVIITDFRREQSHFSENCSCLALLLSREEIDAMTGGASAHGMALQPDAARLILANAARIKERALAGTLRLDQAGRADQTLVSLLHAGIAGQLGHRLDRDTALVAAREQVLRDIEDNLGSPTLTVGRLARRAGLSRSSLYRLFEEENGIQAWIRHRRLERVAAVLGAPGPQPTIGALADRWGFCDAAYLGRLFREAYGKTPGEYRAQAAEAREP
ncbi:helix-turn-helix domain-containing protein [Sphingomonas aracearum]|nr:helix-turn-helix domain-containing protein [Sphingomonas aracearum]